MQSLTIVVKVVSRRVDQIVEIWVYIKALSKLGLSLMLLMTELSTANGNSCVSYDAG